MPLEKAVGIVVRTTDWSESSRVATLWTREFGRVRVLAKGGRRLKSNFEVALDLLTVCSIVLLRKSSGSLDLLTEAQMVERFPRLIGEMPALYAGYYVAELLADWTEDYDPHPLLFDAAVEVLRDLGGLGEQTGPRLAAFELVLLRELGYSPTLDSCAMCEASLAFETGVAFSPAAGGMICSTCAVGQRERLPISRASWQALRSLAETGLGWQQPVSATVRGEIRRLLGHYVSYRMGRQPKLLPYLASLP